MVKGLVKRRAQLLSPSDGETILGDQHSDGFKQSAFQPCPFTQAVVVNTMFSIRTQIQSRDPSPSPSPPVNSMLDL